MIIEFPLRLGNGGNDRKHWRAADRQKRAEKEATTWILNGQRKPQLPCVVTITRKAPSNGVDRDNLIACAKYVRDSVAAWVGVDDKDESQVAYAYEQERGPWGVRIEITGSHQ